MTSPQEQFTELTRRSQEGFRNLWQQWSEKSTELMKGTTSGSRTTAAAGGNPEEVLDAVFDFAEHLIAQQRIFAKQMLAAAGNAQQSATQAAGVTEASTSAASAVKTDSLRSTATETSDTGGRPARLPLGDRSAESR